MIGLDGRAQERDGVLRRTKPVVNPQVGNSVEEEGSGNANGSRGKVQSSEHEHKADIGDEDIEGLVGAEDGAEGVEVADAQPALSSGNLTLLAGLAGGGVEEEVNLPAKELVGNEANDLADGGVLEELVKVGKDGAGVAPGLSRGDKGHVLGDVASEAVVAVVAVLPGEVRDEQEAVEGPTDDVVEAGVC